MIGPWRRTVPLSQNRMPARRRRRTSLPSAYTANTARKYSPLHLTPLAMPKATPAASSQGRFQNTGPHGLVAGSEDPAQSASRRSFQARSSNTAPAPSNANNANIESSNATRLSTIALPSIASSPPAITASSVERKSRCAIIIVTRTSRMPLTATAIRQPNGSPAPNRARPSAMIHLPIGGCATKDGVSRKISGCPALKLALASAGHDPSYPRWESV